LIKYISDNKLSFLEQKGEFLWPAFLLCEQNEETSSQLLQIEKPIDNLAEIYCTKTADESSEEGVLIHFFGTNLFARILHSDLISFEAIPMLGELSKAKKEGPVTKFIRMSFYYFKVLSEKDQEVTLMNYKRCSNRLVYIEDKVSLKKSFAIVLNE
jgi:hypothetical protein